MNFEEKTLDFIKITIIILIIMIIGSEVFSKETGIEPPIVDGELLAYDVVTQQGDYLYQNTQEQNFNTYSSGQGFVNNKFVTYTSKTKCGNIYDIEVTYQDGTKQVIKGYKDGKEVN